jgi:hypothetical protein
LGWDRHFHPPCVLSILPTQTLYPNIYQELHLKALLIARNIWEGFNLLILFHLAFEFTCGHHQPPSQKRFWIIN